MVITASSATEYAFEDGERVRSAPSPSFFTSALVEGLESGAADRDSDGQISTDELYFFIYDRVRERTSRQTPTRSNNAGQGQIFIANAPRRLPPELEDILGHGSRWAKLGLVEELRQHARYGAAGIGTAAQQALGRLSEDTDLVVADAAQTALNAQARRSETGP